MHKNGRTNLEVLHCCLVFGGVLLAGGLPFICLEDA
jgi:hypothetical protein